ncbi:MAG: hypothetical protein K2N76_04440, partial [Muribaculaceae bacterium]|nr:hypothetical protein [Muribaculaceae bacterium]
MRQILLFLLFATVGLAVSCSSGHGRWHSDLAEAERLIDTWELDSAAAVMARLDGASFGSGLDSALYALNY